MSWLIFKRVTWMLPVLMLLAGCEAGCQSAEQVLDDSGYVSPVVEKVD